MKKIYRIIAHEHLQRKNPRNHKIFLETQNLKFNSVYLFITLVNSFFLIIIYLIF